MISIIIPAYNSSEYLKRCLDSIVCQPFEDYEVIVVDDGSTDDTGKVLDEYAKRYSRIKAVHKENGGVSTARNAGLDKAQGDYIIFVDCDDYLSEDAADIINKDLKEDKDLYIYNNFIKNEGGITKSLNSGSFSSIGEMLLEIIEPLSDERNEYLRSMAGKIYRARIIGDLRFSTELHIGEDACFHADLIRGLGDINRIKVSPEAWYVYDRTNVSSATHHYRKDLYSAGKNQLEYLLKAIEGRTDIDERYRNTVLVRFCWKQFWILYFQGQYTVNDDSCFRWYKETEEHIDKRNIYDADFSNSLMNRTFKYRHLLNNELIFNGLQKVYLLRNRNRNV